MLSPVSSREMLISQDWKNVADLKKMTKGHFPKIKKVQEFNSNLEKPKSPITVSHSKLQFIRG